MALRDRLNKKKMDAQGFKPDSTTVSSIMINEIEATEGELMLRERDDLTRRISTDQAEIDKIIKITAKYKENLAKQS